MNATETALEQAIAGLTYESETDAPWIVVYWSAASGTVTPEAIRKLGKHKPDSPVEEKSIDEFFAPLVGEKDWYGDEEKAIAQRYQVLLATIKSMLTDPKVVRIAAKNTVTVYVVGLAKEGGWAGIRTKAVET